MRSLTLGDVSSAVRQDEQSVELADRSGDAFTRTTLATALAVNLILCFRPLPRGRGTPTDDAAAVSPALLDARPRF